MPEVPDEVSLYDNFKETMQVAIKDNNGPSFNTHWIHKDHWTYTSGTQLFTVNFTVLEFCFKLELQFFKVIWQLSDDQTIIFQIVG